MSKIFRVEDVGFGTVHLICGMENVGMVQTNFHVLHTSFGG
jgi:hypothetical protein